MNFLKTVFFSLFVIFPIFFFGQIKISEYIQHSSLAKQNKNALYFVDFWATWCGPCIHATKYIETLQKQYPENFFVLSLSQENPDLVTRYMTKHKNGLAVAIDYDGETFRKNNVSSLPYGVLFNAQGFKVWEGHPADFKQYHVDKFLKQNKSQASVDDMIIRQAYHKNVVEKKLEPQNDFEIFKLSSSIDSNRSLEVIKYTNYLELTGSLQAIFAYTFNSNKNQIIMPSDINNLYTIQFKFNTEAYNNKVKVLLEALSLKQTTNYINGEVLVFDVTLSKLWDTNQINWGNDTQHFLIGDSDIKADNVTINEIKYQLSNILDTPIVINSKNDINTLHDWDIHYKYFDLMVSNMSDNYGILVEKKEASYPQYVISK